MKLNCKPGDLAVVVRSRFGKAVGRVVTVGHFAGEVQFVESGVHPAWHVSPPLHETHDLMLDAWLRPIRDPGEDAQDETLSWLPVPSTEKEAA